MTKGVTGLSLLNPFTSRHQLISSRDQVYNLSLFIEEILLASFSPRRELRIQKANEIIIQSTDPKGILLIHFMMKTNQLLFMLIFFEKMADLFSVQRKNKLFSVQF